MVIIMRWMLSIIAVFAVAASLAGGDASAKDQREINAVPYASGILPNGYIGDGEWDTARVLHIQTPERIDLRLKQDSQYVYIGIHSTDTVHTGIDLYMADTRGHRRVLHISAAHGQCENLDSANPGLVFGINRLWTGNIVENYWEEGKEYFVAPEIFEFQIDKRFLPQSSFRMLIHLKRPQKISPADAVIDAVDNWFEFTM